LCSPRLTSIDAKQFPGATSSGATYVRSKNFSMLVIIAIITFVAAWIDLPGETLDIGGFKERHPVRQGLDLQGGLQVLLEANPPAGQSVDSNTMSGTRDTLERRVNGLGVSEPLIQTRGDNQIVVELPGVQDPDQAIAVLQETALLEIIDTNGQSLPEGTAVRTSLGEFAASASGTPEASPVASPVAADPAAAVTPEVTPDPNSPVYTTIVSGTDLKDAYRTTDQNGAWVVAFELNGDAADKFYDFTSQNVGNPMSIVVDKTVISTATIRNPIAGSGQISGLTGSEAETLALQLKAGALGVPLQVVSSQTIGPSLGQDSIDRSLLAGIVGLTIVALFMIIYYRVPGVLSVVALLIYTAITFALFKTIPITLTLAGIAGLILSIGMAVDANVLIFARLKEELRTGKPVAHAIEAGFNHAWPSIRDSNISTMITCAILYWFGQFTGATIITGFALTLFVGVAVSMFTAITVTRTFLRLLVDAGFIRSSWWLGLERAEIEAIGAAD
jgi:preprotein translocase subunit SecD